MLPNTANVLGFSLLYTAACALGFEVGARPSSYTACTARDELCVHVHFSTNWNSDTNTTINSTYFQVSVEGRSSQNNWFDGADIRMGGASAAGGELSGTSFVREPGSDVHGDFERLALEWRHPNGKPWITEFRVYSGELSAIIFGQKWPDGWDESMNGDLLSTFPSLYSMLVDDASQLNTVSYGSGGCGGMGVNVAYWPPAGVEESLMIVGPSGEDTNHNAVLAIGPSESHAYSNSWRAAEKATLLSSWPRKIVNALGTHVRSPGSLPAGWSVESMMVVATRASAGVESEGLTNAAVRSFGSALIKAQARPPFCLILQ